jgi:5-methylcytosine-specific restriction enzyme subunit McrC
MKTNNFIQVFEHDELAIGQFGFNHSHWLALGWYNEEQGNKYFRLLPNGVKFNQYVGVIQVGNITIEILPKVGRTASHERDKKIWQGVLIDMLNECKWLNLNTTEKASLRFKHNSILEAYLQIFVSECKQLLRSGLIKKYRIVEENSTALKGKLLLKHQIQKNFIHRENFYISHPIYDRNNIFNQIIYKAIKHVSTISQSPKLKDQIGELFLSFPELEDIEVTHITFEKLKFDRKTSNYREAIQIAFMLLLNYRPDIATGRNNILAILFNMNDLWEEYIAVQIRRYIKDDWKMLEQKQKKFWFLNQSLEQKIIQSDIVIKDSINNSIIIDTKWKLPENNIPADDDLKQMFVYSHYWKAFNSILLFPRNKHTEEIVLFGGTYNISDTLQCSIAKVSVLDYGGENLDMMLGQRIVGLLNNLFEVKKQEAQPTQ